MAKMSGDLNRTVDCIRRCDDIGKFIEYKEVIIKDLNQAKEYIDFCNTTINFVSAINTCTFFRGATLEEAFIILDNL